MPAVIDMPVDATPVDPLAFAVRGWCWLDAAQSDIAAVEARVGDELVGQTRALYLRPDVNAALRLPATVRTGFELFAHHAHAARGGPFVLQVEARRRDGSRVALGQVTVATIARDYRENDFGILLD